MEGAAVEDFMRPDRIIVGSDDEQAIFLMKALYSPFQRNRERLVVMDVRSAELTKSAANAMLATRISFMNELALLAEKVGADIELVRQGIGADPRIGYHVLFPGAGYGGSCFPQGVRALIRTAAEHGRPPHVLSAVEAANEAQKRVLVEKVVARFGEDLGGRRFALWGLAFKPGTDDMREAPSRVIGAELLARGATVSAYDPAAMHEARRVFGDLRGLEYADGPMDAVQGADALVIVTEWRSSAVPTSTRSGPRCGIRWSSTVAACTRRRCRAPRRSSTRRSAGPERDEDARHRRRRVHRHARLAASARRGRRGRRHRRPERLLRSVAEALAPRDARRLARVLVPRDGHRGPLGHGGAVRVRPLRAGRVPGSAGRGALLAEEPAPYADSKLVGFVNVLEGVPARGRRAPGLRVAVERLRRQRADAVLRARRGRASGEPVRGD
jgi:hypothetical protein